MQPEKELFKSISFAVNKADLPSPLLSSPVASLKKRGGKKKKCFGNSDLEAFLPKNIG